LVFAKLTVAAEDVRYRDLGMVKG